MVHYQYVTPAVTKTVTLARSSEIKWVRNDLPWTASFTTSFQRDAA